jgi:predicted dithiol-disulfide oxidoreductase (DUF899 family)
MRVTFPNESPAYRAARDVLLQREIELRRGMESVAAELRALPPGGNVPEDYVFDCMRESGVPGIVRMSELFRDGDTLMLYHYMFPRDSRDTRAGPSRGATADLALEQGPCPSCTALIDMWEGTMPHFEGLGGNLAIVAKAPIERLATFAREKGWRHVRLLSAAHNSFRRDYGGDGPDGEPVPIMTVFKTVARRNHPPPLGERVVLRYGRARTGSAASWHRRAAVDAFRSDAARTPRARRTD